ncbi:MAG: ATP-binding cassette domain-containing protein [Acidobacteriota bacterium]
MSRTSLFPAPLLQLRAARLRRGDRLVFESVSLSVARGEIVALCGANGSGKSSILGVLAGELDLSAGQLLAKEAAAGLKQEPSSSQVPVHRRLLFFEPEVYRLALEIDAGRWEQLDAYETAGGYDIEQRAATVASRFGLQHLLERSAETLSPGQLRKVDLAALFSSRAPLLMLDEPTNYLDLEGLTQLEAELHRHREGGGAALIVSHDRALLDAVADRSLHLELSPPKGHGKTERHAQGITESRGGYSSLLALRRQLHQAASERAQTLGRKIRQLEEVARQRGQWAERKEASKRGAGASKPFIAKRAKKMMKRSKDAERRRNEQVQKLEEERPFVEKGLGLASPSHAVARRTVFRARELELPWGTDVPITLSLETSDRCGLLGDNGAGKTTLTRVIQQELPTTAGELDVNSHVPTAWLKQGLEGFFREAPLLTQLCERLETSKTSERARERISESEIRTQLGCLRLRADRVLAAPSELSLGERMRAALVQLALARCDFVFLDEPTTHLDVESIEVLERWLAEATSGFLLVSHDRRLLEQTCDRLFHLSEEGLKEL